MWHEEPLKSLSEIRMGQSPDSSSYNDKGEGLAFLQGCSEFGDKNPVADVYCSAPGKIAPPTSVLISVRAPVGDLNIANQEYCIGRGLAAIIGKRVPSKFLYYSIDLNKAELARLAQGSTFDAVGSKELNNHQVYYPSNPAELARLTEILETADNAIEKTQALIAKYENIKQGMMQDLFTRGVDENGQLRPSYEEAPHLYQETELGWIPKGWKVDLLDSLAQRGSGHTPSKSFPEYWNGGVKWLSLADSWRLDDLYIDDTDYNISKVGIANSSATVHKAGIVVLSRDAGIGKSAITTAPMAVSQHFMCWACGSKMDNHFLYYWMQFKKPLFENIAMGSTILTIGLSFFKRLKISSPTSLDEMKLIGERLKAVDIHIKSLKADLEKLKGTKLGLMQDLLSGKVRVAEDIEERKEAVA